MLKRKSCAFLALAALLNGCQSPSGVAEQFRNATEGSSLKDSKQTSVLFLIDGLSVGALNSARSARTIPHISEYFGLRSRSNLDLGRASFPSLTYPNIASILTGETVADQPIRGNHILFDDRVIDFENIVSWRILGRLVRDRTVFHELASRGETSVSFSYPFPRGATAHLEKNVDAGLSYFEKDYASIDADALTSLDALLQADNWPRFIFVHLIGVDAIEHELGPGDPKVQAYLSELDLKLKPSFDLLRKRSSKVQVVLTADHGFQKTDFKVPLVEVMDKLNVGATVVTDNRMASIFTPITMSASSRKELAEGIAQSPHVSMTILKSGESLELFQSTGKAAKIDFTPGPCSSGFAARFQWREHRDSYRDEDAFHCLEDFDIASSLSNDSFVVSSLAEYFKPAESPDIVVLPDAVSDFTGAYKGNHGGLTVEEMLVPILHRGIAWPQQTLPTSKIIKIMGLKE
jgi:hypothetical protein